MGWTAPGATDGGLAKVVWGSASLPSILREQGLADEVLLVVYLVVLGTEKAFFAERTATRSFELVSRQAVRCGIVFSTHKVSREL